MSMPSPELLIKLTALRSTTICFFSSAMSLCKKSLRADASGPPITLPSSSITVTPRTSLAFNFISGPKPEDSYPGGEHISQLWYPRPAIIFNVPGKSLTSMSFTVHTWNPTGILTVFEKIPALRSKGIWDAITAPPMPKALLPKNCLLDKFFTFLQKKGKLYK